MKIEPIYAPWLNDYQRQLKYIALTLACVGVFNLLAANWFYFPRLVQLYIPQVLLLVSCILAVVFHPNSAKGSAAVACATVMTGLSLASYGQVYQTGADSYQLFLTWLIFLLPWLFYRLSLVYVLFCIISSLTLYLISAQMLYLSSNMLIILASTVFLLQIIIADFYFKSARLIILLPIAIFAIASAVMFTFDYYTGELYYKEATTYWGLSAFILPLLIALWFYYKKWPAGLATVALILAICTTIHIIVSVIFNTTRFNNIITIGIIIAIVVFAWCWGLSIGLKRLLPNVETLTNMPAAFGSWLSALVLFITVFVFSELSIIVAFIFLIAAIIGLKYASSLFPRHLAYIFILCSQFAIFQNLETFNFLGTSYRHYEDAKTIASLPIDAILQIAIVISSWFVTKNQFWRSLQLSILMFVLHQSFPLMFRFILPAGFIIWLIFPAKVLDKSWRRPILVSLFMGILFNIYQQWSFILMLSSMQETFNPWGYIFKTTLGYKISVYDGIYLLLTGIGLYKYRNYLNPIIIAVFTVLALILIWFSQYNLFLLLAALIIICQQKDYFLLSISMFSLAAYLYMLYYTLAISFIIKGGVLIFAAIILSIVAILIARQLKVEAN